MRNSPSLYQCTSKQTLEKHPRNIQANKHGRTNQSKSKLPVNRYVGRNNPAMHKHTHVEKRPRNIQANKHGRTNVSLTNIPVNKYEKQPINERTCKQLINYPLI